MFSSAATRRFSYDKASLRKDAFAGLQVALLTLPQAMAYALVAGLPLSSGLFAAIFSSLIAVIFSSTRFLVVGPVNTLAILLQTSVSEILYANFRHATAFEKEMLTLQIVAVLAFLVGLFQVLAALFKLGRLTQFVSHSVILGYVWGSTFAVIMSQLYVIGGFSFDKESASLFEKGVYFFSHLDQTQFATLSVGLASLVSILLLKRVDKRIPGALITILLATGVVYFFNAFLLNDTLEGVKLVGSSTEASEVIPTISWPLLDPRILNHIVPVAFALALLGIMETTSYAKSMAAKSGDKFSINQEILSVGMGNLMSSFVGGMPVSVSPSRTSLNFASGAQTKLATVFNVIFVALSVSIFGFVVNLIPLATLGALLIITMLSLNNLNQLCVCLKATYADRFVLLVTFASCLLFSLDMAFYIGVILSIIFYLKKAAAPQLMEYAYEDTGEIKALSPSHLVSNKPIRLIKVEGELFFGAAEVFESSLKAVIEDDSTTKVIILQLKNARDIDATACLALIELNESLKNLGKKLLIAGLTYPVWEVLSVSGVIEKIGKENLFLFEEKNPHQYMQRALERAKFLSS